MKKTLFITLIFIIITQITLAEKQIFELMAYDDQLYKNVVLDHFENDTLYVKAFGNIYPVPIDSVKYIKIEKKAHAGKGILFGMIAGGLLIGSTTGDNKGDFKGLQEMFDRISITFGVLGGGLIGALIGSGMGHDVKYNFTTKTLEKKRELIIKLMKMK
ncbi:MAG: hypothetical protein KAR38_17820 [Calditrichia bacterium]|nr:hypothetical protein [Calditrichia bacterium]